MALAPALLPRVHSSFVAMGELTFVKQNLQRGAFLNSCQLAVKMYSLVSNCPEFIFLILQLEV